MTSIMMKSMNTITTISTKNKFWIWTAAIFFAVSFLIPVGVHAQEQEINPEEPIVIQDEFYNGKVVSVSKEETRDEFGMQLLSQSLLVEITGGPEKGQRFSINYEINANEADARRLEKGDRIILGKGGTPDGKYYISDVYRLNVLWIILAFFFVVTVIFARWYGVRAFIGLAISFAIIIGFIVPFIIDGKNPLFISLVGTIAIACTAIFVAHGVKKRTVIAFLSTLLTIGLALCLAILFVKTMRLFGIGTEDAFYLQFAPIAQINLRGLLLGGILIGCLGVLDDVTTAQAAAVEEIYRANKKLGFGELYKRGMSVGREHIISVVNTLVLAYTGASLPLLLLFKIYERPVWVTLNSEIIIEELVRMIVGSIALVFAVPITTLFAAYYFGVMTKKK